MAQERGSSEPTTTATAQPSPDDSALIEPATKDPETENGATQIPTAAPVADGSEGQPSDVARAGAEAEAASSGDTASPTDPESAAPSTTARSADSSASAVVPLAAAVGGCAPQDIFYTVSSQVWKYTAASKQSTQIGSYSFTPEALAASRDGYIYFIPNVSTQPQIYRVDLATGAQTTFTGATPIASNPWWVAGAVNPQNGIYYYADAVGRIYAFDTATNKAIGFVGQTSPAMPNDHGDLAFDSEGNLYLYWANRAIMKVDAADVPVTVQASSKKLTATATGNATLSYSGPYVSGLAWMSSQTDRQLWSTDYTYQNRGIDAQTPGVSSSLKENVLTLPGPASGYIYDMASCPEPSNQTPKLTLSKNLSGRAASADQFTLALEQPAGTVKASATTTGTATGLQTQVAGPIEAEAGVTYTLREVGAGATDLGRYTSSLECRNTLTNAVVPTTGSGGVHTLVYPSDGTSNVSCTFTNLPPASLTVAKQLPGGRFAASDQFTVEVRTGGATGALIDTPGNETTEGQGTTVNAGTGTTGKFELASATQYTITERGEAGVEMTQYAPRITCTDPAGRQTGLPTNAAFDPATGFSLTPQPGAQISCTVSNTASSGAGIGIGEGLTCEAGYIYALAGTNPSSGDTGGYRVRSYTHVYKISTATGAATVAQVEVPTKWGNTTYNGRANALAVSQGGLFSYYSTQRIQAADPEGLPVFRQDNETGETVRLATLNIPSNVVRNSVNGASSTVRGGINPTDGIYWISATIDDTTHHFWAYNTLTGENYGYVGYLTGSGAGPVGGNGDLVFDQDGNMLFVSSSATVGQLWRLTGLSSALAGAPRSSATSIDSNVSKAKLADLTTQGQFNGVTFDNDGYLYVSFTADGVSKIQKLDPNTGAAVGQSMTVSGLGLPNTTATSRSVVDLADCNDPGGLRLQKSYQDGRVAAADNVVLEIGKQGISSPLVGAKATTDGPATGLQDKFAGVIIGVPGGTYVLTETAAAGKLSDYTTSLSCVDKTHGDADVPVRKVSQGRYELDFPGVGTADGELLANVVCTYVNIPNGTVQLEKHLIGARADDADQFQVRIRAGESTVDSATTTGTGAIVENGATGVVRAHSGPDGVLTYTFDEVGWRNGAAQASVLDSYPNPRVTCEDASGLQPEADLPQNGLLADFAGITPVPGAEISCVISNTAKAPIEVQCQPGYVYSLNDDGSLEEVVIDPETGQSAVTSATGWRDKGNAFNGLGVSFDGGQLFAYEIERVGTGPAGRDQIRVFSSSGGSFGEAQSDWFKPEVGEYFYFITGAVNPTNGHYVVGGYNYDAAIGDLVFRAFDYDPDTKQFSSLGHIRTGYGKFQRTNSDIAFDAAGNLYVLESLPDVDGSPVRIHTILASSLAAATGVELPATSTLPFPIEKSKNEGVVGLAFGANGAAYLNTKTMLYTFNPATWEQIEDPRELLTDSADLASCSSPSTLTVQKDVVARLADGDQFRLSAAKGETEFATATTAGTSNGIQREQIGPVPVFSDGSVSYNFGEAAAGSGSLGSYASSWACTDQSGKAIASGEGMAGSVRFDPVGLTVTCVITNEPLTPIKIEKLGQNCDVGEPTCALPGAEFALYDTDPAAAGAEPITAGIQADPADGSVFTSIGLAPGTYWLVETKAPAGFVLLASPVKFQLTAAGVALDTPSDVVSVKAGDTFTVQVLDATAAPLPKSGGDGPWPFLGLGLVLLLAGAALTHTSGRRPAHQASR